MVIVNWEAFVEARVCVKRKVVEGGEEEWWKKERLADPKTWEKRECGGERERSVCVGS
jgi:hypothetical protein